MTEQTNKDRAQKGILPGGQKAPNFMLKSNSDENVSLKNFAGKPVILAFYPADWSPVCGDQLALYNEILPEFKRFGAELIGISVDGVWSHKAYSEAKHLHFPLLSDFHPKGEVGRMFGVYDETKGKEQRALFVIDPEGKIFWSYLSPSGENPGADGILLALEKMQASNKEGTNEQAFEQNHE